jgi:hypothetical protein
MKINKPRINYYLKRLWQIRNQLLLLKKIFLMNNCNSMFLFSDQRYEELLKLYSAIQD